MGIKNHIGKKNKIRCDNTVLDASLNEYNIRLRTIREVHRVQLFRFSSIDFASLSTRSAVPCTSQKRSGIVHPT